MAITPAAVRANFSDLYGANQLPVLEEIFRTAFEMFPRKHESLFPVRSTDRDIWQSTEMHDLPQHSLVPEGTEFSFKRQKQGASKTLTIQKYGLGVSISEEAVSDGKFDMISELVRELGRSAAESREIQAMDLFNNGFGTTTTADGQPWFDAAHTLPSGLTFRNELATSADLDVTSLETALVDFETQFISDNNKQLMIQPKVLLVHPSNKRLAKELTGSELKPGTADNNLNAVRDDGLRVEFSPHLTDTDSWYLLSMPTQTGMRRVDRTGVETKIAPEAVGFTTDSILYKSRYRWQIDVIHPYGSYGSPGA